MNKVKFLASFVGLFVFMSFSVKIVNDWVVPEKYQKMKNPVSADAESLKMGKSIYNKHCKSCHGTQGWGDGSKAAQLKTPCGDFSQKSFQAQVDGAIFYKTKFGRDDMPNFEKKIPYDEDIWHVVNYVRTLGK